MSQSKPSLAISRMAASIAWTAACHVKLFGASGRRDFHNTAIHEWGAQLAKIMGIEVELAGPTPPEGVLLMCNHRSHADVPTILSAVDCTMVAKAEVRRWPILGSGAAKAGVVFVERGDRQSGAQAQEQMAKALSQGTRVVIFPEGTTLPPPGLGPMKPGSFRMAAQHSFPIVPVALEYERDEVAWVDEGDGSFLPHFIKNFGYKTTRARVAFGPIIQSSDAVELEQQVRQWIEANLKKPTPR